MASEVTEEEAVDSVTVMGEVGVAEEEVGVGTVEVGVTTSLQTLVLPENLVHPEEVGVVGLVVGVGLGGIEGGDKLLCFHRYQCWDLLLRKLKRLRS